MRTQNGRSESSACTTDPFESIREKADALRVIMLVVGMQLMIRAMMLLRRCNY